MSERSPEQHHQSAEHSAELAEAAREQLAKIEHNAERPDQGERKSAVEKARHQVETQPVPREAESAKGEQEKPDLPKTKFDLEQNYAFTMRSLQRSMPAISRTFSKVIHNPVVDTVSEVAGKTIFRPSIALGATTAAALLGGFVYFVARASGFELAGSEFWLALVAGGLIGLIIETVYKALRGGSRFFRH